MGTADARRAGALLFVGVLQFAILEMVSEFVYPGYSVSSNYISDLGPPCQGGVACGSQTSWVIFDSSIVVMGLLVLLSAYYLYRAFGWKPLAGLVGLAGFGSVGVGVFNETAPLNLHDIFSLITFLGIGLAALTSYRFQKKPLSYIAVLMGIVTLLSLVLYVPDSGVSAGAYLGIGPGGLERMIVFPVLFWSLGFGGYLMAT